MRDDTLDHAAVGKRIRQLRHDNMGLSQEAFAALLGVTRGAVGNWELGKGIKFENLQKIALVLDQPVEWLATGRGSGPVGDLRKPATVLEKLLQKQSGKRIISSFDPDQPDEVEDETLTFGRETGFRGAPEGTSPQIDITGGMGAGGLSIVNEGVPGHKGMTFAAEAVSDYWRLPPAVYTSLGLHPQDTVFIPVQGDSMYPTLEEGDVVVVDTRHRWPSPDGIYAILDEIGGLVVKRLEVSQENGENVIRIISDNTRHRIKEKRPDDVFIVGRVLRRFGVIK